MLELSVEAYLVKRCKELGGIATKNDARMYIGIPDRTARFLGYICDVECKRPVGGRLRGAQKMWKKMLTATGTPWHLIDTTEKVDGLIEWVRNGHHKTAEGSHTVLFEAWFCDCYARRTAKR